MASPINLPLRGPEGHDDSESNPARFPVPRMRIDTVPKLSLKSAGALYGPRNIESGGEESSDDEITPIVRDTEPRKDKGSLMRISGDIASLHNDLRKIILHLRSKVGHRDYVLFVDVSETMRDYIHDVYGVLKVITYVARRTGTGGVELFLSSDPQNGHPGHDTKSFLDRMKKQSWDGRDFAREFGDFTAGIIRPRLRLGRHRILFPGPAQKPLTVFVLTDGRWSTSIGQTRIFQRQIQKTAELMRIEHVRGEQISIQFIKFGDDERSMNFLQGDYFSSAIDQRPLKKSEMTDEITKTLMKNIVSICPVDVNISDIFGVATDADIVDGDNKRKSLTDYISAATISNRTQSLQKLAQRHNDVDWVESNNMQSRHKTCVSEVAEFLVKIIRSFNADIETLRQLLSELPGLLDAMALKIGHEATTQTSQMCRDVTIFLHKHKNKISVVTGLKIDRNDDGAQEADDIITSGEINWKARIGHWLAQTAAYDTDHQEEERISVTEPENQDNELYDRMWLSNWRECLFNSTHFEWLITRLRNTSQLIIMKPHPNLDVRPSILSYFALTGRKSLSESYSATLEFDWDLLHFFETQEYVEPPEETLENVITLTGCTSDAQAVTCIQYTRQTWPITGEITLELIKSVLKSGVEHSCKHNGTPHLEPLRNNHTGELPDGTSLRAWTSGPRFRVEATGVASSIAETAEQLGWLGAALRTSPREAGLVTCTPTILNISRELQPSSGSDGNKPLKSIACSIGFRLEEVPQIQTVVNGQCWHGIFKNPVIVQGYPIQKRTTWGTGLQVPLNIMATLAHSRRIDHFNSKVYIKGFSTLLVPVKRTEDIIFWHLFYKQDGSHISFLDDTMEQENDLCHLPLQDFRHVLGWCMEAKFYGALSHHPVTHSRLGRPNSTGALFNTSFSSGRIITGGPSFCIGVKDQGVHLSRSGHITQLRWILRKFVLLWDEGEKRGWLINGASALLQLVQASLKYDKSGPFSEVFLFNENELHQSSTPLTAKSAISVLINDSNRELKLYREDAGYQLFKDRVDHFYNILEKLIEHQAYVAGRPDNNFGRAPRSHLEGWDFQEISKMNDKIGPYVANIDTKGKSWVDFTRAIQAVTLVGRGFGDLIQPKSTNLCDQWTTVPTQKYYIASCVSDLRDIMNEHSFENDGHVRLGETTIWHSPTSLFEACQHQGTSDKHHCEPVQTLFPSEFSRFLQPSRHQVPQDDHGAIIFGHNSNFPWLWEDTGHPQKIDIKKEATSSPPVEVECDSNGDSDIAQSLELLKTSDQPPSWSGTSSRVTSPSIGLYKAHVKESTMSCDRDMAYTRTEYTVGIICALPKELAAVLALFDIKHDRPKEKEGYNDSNRYEFGMMAGHMVVAAALPAGEYGTNSAASVATNMHRSFPALSFCLVVGIGGGVPTKDNDIRLGDVVVGIPQHGLPSVIQYDIGKEKGYKGFQRTGTLHDPPRFLLTTISHLMAKEAKTSSLLSDHLLAISLQKDMSRYGYPLLEDDVLLESCTACRSSWRRCPTNGAHIRKRPERETKGPVIHYGPIASGNRVIKDAVFRDKLAKRDHVLCFEMEAAGVMNELNCLVIRGICDYCDKNKNDVWQEYAAAAAASFAKVYLNEISPRN